MSINFHVHLSDIIHLETCLQTHEVGWGRERQAQPCSWLSSSDALLPETIVFLRSLSSAWPGGPASSLRLLLERFQSFWHMAHATVLNSETGALAPAWLRHSPPQHPGDYGSAEQGLVCACCQSKNSMTLMPSEVRLSLLLALDFPPSHELDDGCC